MLLPRSVFVHGVRYVKIVDLIMSLYSCLNYMSMRESREIYLCSIFLYYDYELTIMRNRSQYGERSVYIFLKIMVYFYLIVSKILLRLL